MSLHGSVDHLIHDKVLSPRTLSRVSSWASSLPFAPPDRHGIWSGNAPHNPLLAQTVLWPFGRSMRNRLKGTAVIPEDTVPTGTPMDTVLRSVRKHVLSSPFASKVLAESAGITATVLNYQPNSGLVWHTDARFYTLAFALYIHSSWHENGGGMLLLRDADHPEAPAYAVPPRPNRMVLIPGQVEHAVSLVSNYEGNSSRLTISGFFVRKDSVDDLIRLRQ